MCSCSRVQGLCPRGRAGSPRPCECDRVCIHRGVCLPQWCPLRAKWSHSSGRPTQSFGMFLPLQRSSVRHACSLHGDQGASVVVQICIINWPEPRQAREKDTQAACKSMVTRSGIRTRSLSEARLAQPVHRWWSISSCNLWSNE
jgi:hypothetical protein